MTDRDRYKILTWFAQNNSWGSQYRFQDSADGVSINTDKWDITNLDTDGVQITQCNAIQINSLGEGASVSYWRNMVQSKIGSKYGTFQFSLFSITPTNESYQRAGIRTDDDNRIEFYNKLSGNYQLAFRIVVAGNTEYEVEDVGKDFGIFKIIVKPGNLISAYRYFNDIWVQIGATQTYDIGIKKVYLATRVRGPISRASMRDISIKNTYD